MLRRSLMGLFGALSPLERRLAEQTFQELDRLATTRVDFFISDRPWALEIDAENRVPGYEASETFHPIFLYELIYNLTIAGLLMLIGWRFRIKPPGLFALYVALYCFGRFFEELWRIDPAHEFGPLRLNGWVSAVLFVLATGFFIYWQFLRDRRPREGRRGLRRQKKEPPPPKMAIPKGRVRPSR